MLQDIAPRRYSSDFGCKKPEPGDYLLLMEEDGVLLAAGAPPRIPSFARVRAAYPAESEGAVYLFSVDESGFYLVNGASFPVRPGFVRCGGDVFRTMEPGWMSFAGSVAGQLSRWYRQHVFCGKCGAPMRPAEEERMLACGGCGQTEYPKISPAIIVGIIRGEEILLSKYAGRAYGSYALIAGFMEIGETLEDTLRREVMEEVGLRVKNIRYYRSQPWPFTDSLLVGFFADLDGSGEIRLDERELALAEWVHRDDIPAGESNMSLTRTMMEAFRERAYPGA